MKSEHPCTHRKTELASTLAALLGTTLIISPAQADIYTFSFGPGASNPIDLAHTRVNEGLFTILDPAGNPLRNTSLPYYYDYDNNWGYGFRTQITGTLTFDTADYSGSATILPFQFFNGGPAVIHGLNFTDAGIDPVTGNQLVLANMVVDWNFSNGIPVALTWDVDGLISAISGGLSVGDTVSGGSLPASDSIRKGLYPVGPSPVASTTWDATNTCFNNCSGVNPSGSLPLLADTIGGDPMYAGPFPGFNANFDLATLRVVSIVRDNTPAFSVSMLIPDGTQQECTTTGGTHVDMNAVVRIDPPLEIKSLTWELDGEVVASGESVRIFVPQGIHDIETILESKSGDVTSSSNMISIEDTVGPEIHVAFTSAQSGETISELAGPGLKRASVSIDVQDTCDPAPVSSATAGLSVVNNDQVITLSPPGNSDAHLLLDSQSDSIELSVTAEDAAGNMSNKKTTLTVSQ